MAPNKIKLSREHITAVEHNRRVIINYDTGAEMVDMAAVELEKLISNYFEHIDDAETQIDSVLWQECHGCPMRNGTWIVGAMVLFLCGRSSSGQAPEAKQTGPT